MKKILSAFAGAALALMLGLLFFAAVLYPGGSARADVASSPCDGNICSGSVTVGGQVVAYEYTQHLNANGQLRIRLSGGTYSTSQLISFIIYGVPRFSTWDKFANPSGGAVYLPEEDVNPGKTAYERRDGNGCSGCVVDQVMTLGYSGLAAGTYAFSLTVIQNGASGDVVNIPFYVDANAPLNTDESDAWSTTPRPPGTDFSCADNADDDLDYYPDCADSQCVGEVGRVADNAVCQSPETTCDDGFDNNGNGKTDCADPQCDGLLGRQSPAANCQYANEKGSSTCGDTFDNDADGLTDCSDNVSSPTGNPTNSCWKQASYGCPAVENCSTGFDDDIDQSYSQSYDAQPTTGINCQDADCAGDAACPSNESQTPGGTDADAQCFDGLDNDLDGPIDCADDNCKGIVNPNNPSQVCYDKEFDLGQRYQFCSNAFDDDGDVAIDCADADCSGKFGNCGPCPSREDYRYNSCADATDNDADSTNNCADADCSGGTYAVIGATVNAAICAAGESGADQCGDGLDNNADGDADCADASCGGATRCEDNSCAFTYACETANETICNDGQDNDGDGVIDCVDTDCAGVDSCAANSWSTAVCQTVPSYSALKTFTSVNPTVSARSYQATHVNATDVVQLTGSSGIGGSYDSITMFIGDNTDPDAYYPYASSSDCVLAGTGASQLDFRVVPGHAVQIFNRIGEAPTAFDVTLTCDTPGTPAAAAYPISISVLKQPGNVPEYGDQNFSTTLYEDTPPSVTEVEAEGDVPVSGSPTLNVRYDSSRRFRAVPNDPGTGLDQSGICGCTVSVGGTEYATPTSTCITPALPMQSDFLSPALDVHGQAEDGAGNAGAASSTQQYKINVIPAVTNALTMSSPAQPFFKNGAMDAGVSAEFTTATASTFAADCEAFLYTDAGTLVGPGAFATFAGQTLGNFTRCQSTVTLPSVADGQYFLSIRATDDQGDAAETNRKITYLCNVVPRPGDAETICSKADFDGDNAAEGLYTTLYTTAPKSCDNCVNLANDQADANANGVGDSCEPPDMYGRCEIDRDIVCQCDSDADPGCLGPRCPAPSIAPPNVDPQKCRDPWGLCTLGGEICFENSECPGGQGLCSGDGLTACYRDQECEDAGGICIGADRCEDLIYPWLQAVHGNVFSKKKISAPELPPEGQHNATYCVTAAGTIVNFSSELCVATTDAATRYDRPKPDNFYRTVLGKIDLVGLEGGKYGPVIHVTPAQFFSVFNSNPLAGKVYVVDAANADDLVIDSSITVYNAAGGGAKGNGTVLVKGRDLRLNANVSYDNAPITSTTQLASIGWLVVPDDSGNGGNISVNKIVTDLAGAFVAAGDDGFYTVAAPDTDGPNPLTVSGLAIARRFFFSRTYKSRTRGAEQFNFDGRATANPPPGLEDVSKSLPVFGETPLQ